MKLSDQALGAIMMALQKALTEQTDIVPVLKSFELDLMDNGELLVKNPPIVKTNVNVGVKDAEIRLQMCKMRRRVSSSSWNE